MSDDAKRRLRERVFGDVLPDTTADEREPGTGRDADDGSGEAGTDAWLRANVPPHHG